MDIKILIIDDHQLYIEGLKAIFPQLLPNAEILSVNHIENLDELNQDLDMILLDLRMPNGGAVAVLDYLKTHRLTIPVLIVSASEHSSDIKLVFEHGAMGYLPKTASSDDLLEAIKTIQNGDKYIPEQWNKFMSTENQSIVFNVNGEHIRLSPRLYETLQLIDKGFSNKEISTILGISSHTVSDYVKVLFQRLDTNSRTELIHTARALNLFKFQ